VSEIIKLTVALTMVCVVSGIIISFTHSSTAQKIEAQKLSEQKSALAQVFAPGARIIDTAGTPPLPRQYWVGRNGPLITGYAFAIECKGHSGSIRCIAGIDEQGKITGIKILSQSETPGLGARVEEMVSGKSLWNAFWGGSRKNGCQWFMEQFKGTSVDRPLSVSTAVEWQYLPEKIKTEFTGSNTVSAISGATVTTKAIVAGLEKNLSAWYTALHGVQR
jgi:Na+-translocating ferredoxin:NAD+ oxidoreductase subunit G